MDSYIQLNQGAEGGLVAFLKFLLTEEKVDAVFTLRRIGDGDYDYGLITDVDKLEDAVPLHPFMPVNAGQVLSRLTPMKKRVAVVVKPCEMRAFVELVKRAQASLDPFFFISFTCGGGLPLATTMDGDAEPRLAAYWQAVSKGDPFDGIRPTCRACVHFVPKNVDATVSMIGEKIDETGILYLHSESAKRMVEGYEGKWSEGELESQAIEALREKRQSEKVRLFKETESAKGLDGMIEEFGKCIGCHGCSRVCPICHCILCDFESHLFDYETSILERELVKKGGLRLPPDTILYQLGRLNHMSYSCVGCGMCTEVCPAGIPVSAIFMRTGEDTANLFDYVPGREIDEPVPVTVYKEEELLSLGES